MARWRTEIFRLLETRPAYETGRQIDSPHQKPSVSTYTDSGVSVEESVDLCSMEAHIIQVGLP